jgi:urease accessory protein
MDQSYPAPTHQRSKGTIHLTAQAPARLHTLHQSGCLRALFPRAEHGTLEAVLLNTAGGIADGDILATSLSATEGAALTITTAAAERIYRARPGAAPAQLSVRIAAAAHARLAYLPQETILFDQSALHRTLRIDLDTNATYLGVEMLVFGRAASGETVRDTRLHDSVQLRRAGHLLLHDAIILGENTAQTLAGPATAAGATAIGSLIYAAPDAASRLAALREALHAHQVSAGATTRNDLLLARIVAPDSQRLRAAIRAALATLREAPLPRVWNC